MSKTAVIGSLNMDLVIQTPRMPNLGETITGHSFKTIPGGKGANQAVACARLGADTFIVGKVGEDEFGQTLRSSLRSFGVDISGLTSSVEDKTGVAMIMVSGGDNLIVLSEGANGKVSISDIIAHEPLLEQADTILLQFEIPMETVKYVINKYKGIKRIFLNPAPAKPINSEMLNEHEAAIIFGLNPDTENGFMAVLDRLKAAEVKYPLVTLGERGVAYFNGTENKLAAACKVDVVDTTAAGDTFTGGLAAAVSAGKSIDEAVTFAQKAAALVITKYGAQTSIPNLSEVENF